MISAYTNQAGQRTYRLPQAVADVALALFPDMDQCGAVFRLAKKLSWCDVHTLANIALNCSHIEAVDFARTRMEKSALVARRIN